MHLLVAYILLVIFRLREGSSVSPPASGFRDSSPLPISLKTLAFSLDLMELESTGCGSNRSIYIYIYIYIWFTTKCYPFTRWDSHSPPGLSRACDTSIVERLKSPRTTGNGMKWTMVWPPLEKFGKHLLLRGGWLFLLIEYLMYSTLGLWAKYVVTCVRSMEVNIWDSHSAFQLSALSTVIHKSLRLRSSDNSAQIAGVAGQLLAVPTGHQCHPTLSFQIQHSKGVTNRISPGDAPKFCPSFSMSRGFGGNLCSNLLLL